MTQDPASGISELLAEAGTLSLERIPMLGVALERMANGLAERLRPLASTAFLCQLEGPDLTRLGDCIDGLDQRAIICVAHDQASDSRVVFAVERNLLDLLSDALFGGAGNEPDLREGQPFTTLELRIAETVCDLSITSLCEGISDIAPLRLRRERTETRMDLAGAGKRSLMAVRATCAIHAFGRIGQLHALLPQPLLQALRDDLEQSAAAPRPPDPRWTEQFRRQLEQADLRLDAILCEFPASLGAISQWRCGAVLPLDGDIGRNMRLEHAGEPVLFGTLGQTDTRYGLKIDSFADQSRSFIETLTDP